MNAPRDAAARGRRPARRTSSRATASCARSTACRSRSTAARRSASSASRGCGKSVTALSILRLIASPPGRIVAGQRAVRGPRPARARREHEMRAVRGNEISMIFQEPMTSLNPVLTVGRQIAESADAAPRPVARGGAGARGRDAARWCNIPEPRAARRASIRTSSRAACASA